MQVNKNLLGLFNGVSQQPASMRLDSQCEIQENAMSGLVDGLYKRMPVEFVTRLNTKATVDAFTHKIVRDSTEKYEVLITGDANDPIEVYNVLTGAKQLVQYGHYVDGVFTPDASVKNYLTYGSFAPRSRFKATTVADYTIITNRQKVCAMSGTITDYEVNAALVYVKNAVVNVGYTVSLSEAGFWYWVNPEAHPLGVNTEQILGHLMTHFHSLGLGNLYQTAVSGPVVYIKRWDGGDFYFKVNDSWGDMALLGFKGTCMDYQDLPPEGVVNGMKIKVSGKDGNNYDDYYVEWGMGGGFGDGAWKESRKSGLCNIIDKSTMPHKLVRVPGGSFVFSDIDYAPRTVGDELSAPHPSFIGGTINDVFFYKNRLGFLSGENVIMSKSSEFWQFFPTTVMDVLDDDPIDVAVSTNNVNILHSAIPFDKNILLIAENQQFVLHSGTTGGLTPSNIVCDPTTAFTTYPYCAPVAAGSNVYFATPAGDYSLIREYYVQPDSMTDDAADITAHVPNYVPAWAFKMVTAPALDMLFVLSGLDRKCIWVYKFYWQGDEKVQSSWSKWTFENDIIGIDVIDNYLYIVFRQPTITAYPAQQWNSTTLCRINLTKKNTGTLPFTVHLDDLVLLTGVYDANLDVTTWTLPYLFQSKEYKLINSATGAALSFDLVDYAYDEDDLRSWALIFDDVNRYPIKDNPLTLPDERFAIPINHKWSFDYPTVYSQYYGHTVAPLENLYPVLLVSLPKYTQPLSVRNILINNEVYTLLAMKGDHSAVDYYIGRPYKMKYRFSQWYQKSSDNKTNLSANLKIRRLKLGFTNTGYFRVIITPYRRYPLVHEYTGHVTGVSQIGIPDIVTGDETFLAMCNTEGSTIDIENDTYLPTNIHIADFEGFLTLKSNKM